MQRYVRWRRQQVRNPLVNYHAVNGEAMRVRLESDGVSVELRSGEKITADRLLMASGSISVKVPAYLEAFRQHERVIIDPLTLEGHQRRQQIPAGVRVLILGTGLTGEEQASILYQRGHKALAILSRHGLRHFTYYQDQSNRPLILDEAPDFLLADTPEEFDEELTAFYERYLKQGHSHEDILAAIRPHWDEIRAELGGCYNAAGRLKLFRRALAVNSIGTSFEVAQRLEKASSEGSLRVLNGQVEEITERDGAFIVRYSDTPTHVQEESFDYIINAVGRNIIRHPIWEDLLKDEIAVKHAGIGVRVSETGQMINAQGEASERIWVVGMARAGDHALRHGFLGNTAFNVPQVRAHLYDTIDAILGDPCPHHTSKINEVIYRVSRDGINARLKLGEETPLVWAVSEGYPEIAVALIKAGANIDACNSKGNSALIRAACEGRLALAQALIDAGAQLDVQNEDGYTALILARRRGHEDIARVLVAAGANQELVSRGGFSFSKPGSSPKPQVCGPRDAELEAQLLALIRSQTQSS
jgi:uncharacterized NAD(P)/FAD-binding protein YdhS